jgi:hypothetical protein
MIRAVAAAFALGLAATTAALATAENRAASDNSGAAQTGSPTQTGTMTHNYVRAACDTRRPSCRKWRSLANERIQNEKEGN